MIVDMKGNPIPENAPFKNIIMIQIDDRLESDRFLDFIENYLTPFMEQLNVPVIDLNYY